jgi:hypothetical protein
MVVSSAVIWVGEARSFSHQQRLTADVARVLVGEEPAPISAGLHNVPSEGAKQAVASNETVKKVELAIESSVHWLARDTVEPAKTLRVLPFLSTLRASPPHEPPRAAVVS